MEDRKHVKTIASCISSYRLRYSSHRQCLRSRSRGSRNFSSPIHIRAAAESTAATRSKQAARTKLARSARAGQPITFHHRTVGCWSTLSCPTAIPPAPPTTAAVACGDSPTIKSISIGSNHLPAVNSTAQGGVLPATKISSTGAIWPEDCALIGDKTKVAPCIAAIL